MVRSTRLFSDPLTYRDNLALAYSTTSPIFPVPPSCRSSTFAEFTLGSKANVHLHYTSRKTRLGILQFFFLNIHITHLNYLHYLGYSECHLPFCHQNPRLNLITPILKSLPFLIYLIT